MGKLSSDCVNNAGERNYALNVLLSVLVALADFVPLCTEYQPKTL